MPKGKETVYQLVTCKIWSVRPIWQRLRLGLVAKVLGVIPFTFCYTKLRKYLFNDCQTLRLLSASKLTYNKKFFDEHLLSIYMGIGSEVV